VTHTIDRELIGGFVIYSGGYRYDYSVKGQLERLSGHLKGPDQKLEDADLSGETKSDIEAVRASLLRALNDFDEEPTVLFEYGLMDKKGPSGRNAEDRSSVKIVSEEKLRQRSFSFSERMTVEEVGRVHSVSDGVAFVEGIDNCMFGETILFGSRAFGIAMNLEKDRVGIVLLGDIQEVVEGSMCRRTGKTVEIPVGTGLLGRVIDSLGQPIDGRGMLRTSHFRHIESPAPGIIERCPVNTPLQTGITVIDALTPIGRGQRELIIGDRQTGKTAVVLDAIINQRGKNVLCVYVAIGQKMSTIVQLVQTLEKHNALSYTVIVAAGASEQASMQYIAPYAGCAVAEYFMYEKHRDVLIVYDDLTKHAQAYRAISLLLRRPPGREAYPGDVFYIHSRLLERAANLDPACGGGSITALPIIETQGGDISAYIPTNVISITDGQIYLESELFFSGQRPAVNVGLSVSRVGGAAQTHAMKKLSGPLRINLAQAREMAAFAQFGSDLDEGTQLQLKRGEILGEVLKQPQFEPLATEEQVVILYLATAEKMIFLKKEDVREYAFSFLRRLRVLHPEVLSEIANTGELSESVAHKLNEYEIDHHAVYLAEHQEYSDKE
jgi:F-type H+-transporting ATPase subunit alpha